MVTPPDRVRKPLERPTPSPIPGPPLPYRPLMPMATDEIHRVLREILARLDSIERRLSEIERALSVKPR